MKGINQLVLNQATMIEIVEYWLANKWLNKDEESPRVTSVESSDGKIDIGFRITIQTGEKSNG